MKKLVTTVIFSIGFLFSCTTDKNSSNLKNETEHIQTSQNLPAVISGKIINSEVYPHIKDIKLTIPGFEGDEMEVKAEINDSGLFAIEFYPKTKREVQLYPIEDILVIQPGDSLFIIKDFSDIENSSFYGDRSELNDLISNFRHSYLGRYPTDYQQPYMEYKNECEKEKDRNYQSLIEFQEHNPCSDEFNNWAIKLIELDYCTALFQYPFQYFLHTKTEIKDTSEYFSFFDNLEDKIDKSIVMSKYFTITQQFLQYQTMKLRKNYQQRITKKDTIIGLMIEDLFSSTENDYLAQFTLRALFNTHLTTNKTDWIDNYSDQINNKLKDSFLRNNLKEHYDRIQEFNNNPKRFSDAILSSKNNIELNKGVSINSGKENNTVKDLIKANHNKVIFVDVWATWCAPCIYNLKYSKQLIAEFKNKNVEFAFICINSKEELWREKVNEMKIGGQHFFCDFETSKAIKQRFNFSGIPYYILINKEGTIVDFGNHLNPQSEYVKTQIEKLLKE